MDTLNSENIKILTGFYKNTSQGFRSSDDLDSYWELVRLGYLKNYVGMSVDWHFRLTEKGFDILEAMGLEQLQSKLTESEAENTHLKLQQKHDLDKLVKVEAENEKLKAYLIHCAQWFDENGYIQLRLQASKGFDFLKPMKKLLNPQPPKETK